MVKPKIVSQKARINPRRREGRAAAACLPVNQPLGLTDYCWRVRLYPKSMS
jgi:hypothetical protein